MSNLDVFLVVIWLLFMCFVVPFTLCAIGDKRNMRQKVLSRMNDFRRDYGIMANRRDIDVVIK